jgi:archaellum component FlaC
MKSIKNEVVSLNRDIIQLKNHISNAKLVLEDLNKDIKFLEKQNETIIVCPICGTEHLNNLEIKYSIYRDKEDCQSIISDSTEELGQLQHKKQKLVSLIPKLNDDISSIQNILNQRKKNISLESVIEAIGIKNIVENMDNDIKTLSNRLTLIDGNLKNITSKLTKLTKSKNGIQGAFSNVLNSYFSKLEVADEDHFSSKKMPYTIKSTGSDNPRGVLALIFAYFEIIQQNKYATVCPLVIDSPFQQDQGSQKTELIMKVIHDKRPDNSQIIVATTTWALEDKNMKVYNFTDEKQLLIDSDYKIIQDILEEYKNTL